MCGKDQTLIFIVAIFKGRDLKIFKIPINIFLKFYTKLNKQGKIFFLYFISKLLTDMGLTHTIYIAESFNFIH